MLAWCVTSHVGGAVDTCDTAKHIGKGGNILPLAHSSRANQRESRDETHLQSTRMLFAVVFVTLTYGTYICSVHHTVLGMSHIYTHTVWMLATKMVQQ
jgi:hypothetical protein